VTPEQLTAYAVAKPGAWPDNPWDHIYPVIKVGEDTRAKIFVFIGADGVGVKSGDSRDEADEWLDRHPADTSVMAYIGRSGWNDLVCNRGIPDDEILEAIDESYRRVVAKLPKKHRPPGWDEVHAP